MPIVLLVILLLLGCGKDEGIIFPSPASMRGQVLVIISGDGNHRGISIYDIDGNYLSSIDNLRTEGGYPRGVAAFSEDSFLVTIDTPDQLLRVFFDGTVELFAGSGNFAGTVYGLTPGPENHYYSFESNRIERFDTDGNQDGSNWLNGTVGSCTLSTPRGLSVSSEGNLLVTNQGGSDVILRIGVEDGSPTCVSSVAFGGNPFGIVEHSNGKLYVSKQSEDAIYETDADGSNGVSIWDPGTSILNDPTAIIEMPNGNLLVSSASTDSIERVTTAGVRVGTESFIKDTHSLNIIDMVIIDAEER